MAGRVLNYEDLPTGDGVLVLSRQGVVLAAALQTERLLRRKFEPGQTLKLAEVFAEPYLTQAEQAIEETFPDGTSRSNMLAQGLLESGQVLPEILGGPPLPP